MVVACLSVPPVRTPVMPSTRHVLLTATLILCAACSATAPAREDGESHWSLDAVDPVSAPLTFESPLVHTSVRPVALYHSIPETNLLGGGRLKAFAVQARWAVTDRFAVIATKDGRAKLQTGILKDETGWLDIAAGVKYVIVDDPESKTLVTTGLTYETTAGDRDLFQGNGEGLFRPFVSALFGGDAVNVTASVAASLPVDGGAESSSVDYHLHFSPVTDSWFIPVAEINGIHYFDNGSNLPFNFEGVDYANLGSSGVQGHDIITAAVGARMRTGDNSTFGLAYERPVTNREDIFEDRITADWLLRF